MGSSHTLKALPRKGGGWLVAEGLEADSSVYVYHYSSDWPPVLESTVTIEAPRAYSLRARVGSLTQRADGKLDLVYVRYDDAYGAEPNYPGALRHLVSDDGGAAFPLNTEITFTGSNTDYIQRAAQIVDTRSGFSLLLTEEYGGAFKWLRLGTLDPADNRTWVYGSRVDGPLPSFLDKHEPFRGPDGCIYLMSNADGSPAYRRLQKLASDGSSTWVGHNFEGTDLFISTGDIDFRGGLLATLSRLSGETDPRWFLATYTLEPDGITWTRTGRAVPLSAPENYGCLRHQPGIGWTFVYRDGSGIQWLRCRNLSSTATGVWS